MALNLHQIRLFTAVVDEGGFTKAAAALDLSQSAISKAINDLERRLGVILLDRSSRAVALTDAGQLLYGRAKELFGVERVVERELREMRGSKRGVLRVAATPTIATYILPRILGRFRRRHPSVEIDVRRATPPDAMQLLLRWRVDVAIVDGNCSSTDIDVSPWRDDELVVIASPEHPFAGTAVRTAVRAADLASETLVAAGPRSSTRMLVEQSFAGRGVRFQRIMRVRATEGIKQAVAAGLGIAVVSREAADDQIAAGRLVVVPVADLEIRRTLSILRRRDRAVPAAVRELLALLDDHPPLGRAVADARVS